ncbi:MAG: hypothetical protein JF597_09405 [Streptomyces sp.]|uniref:hypothetical protein n=1 Tax=Streptomyces sp. TaxID=1931 RepID=UPI0025CCA5D7|nr:hypothetical protein [Streptomyces sp.]MBW8793789.1 hypothetical protein [Streptomyces sp.]
MSNPVPTSAFQMFFAESCTVQPVARCAPVMTGCAPSAAFQFTVWPPVPESAAVKVSGAVSR